jgi:delta-aminolevulinic acid dehydratase/porphobilinogen synthase
VPLDEKRMDRRTTDHAEILMGIHRAEADMVLTCFAKAMARWLTV